MIALVAGHQPDEQARDDRQNREGDRRRDERADEAQHQHDGARLRIRRRFLHGHEAVEQRQRRRDPERYREIA